MKKRISSRMTWWLKWGYPLCAVLFCMVWLILVSTSLPPMPEIVVIAPFIFVVASLALARKFIRPLADMVWDAGDALIVSRDGEEERIALANIVNVSYGQFNGWTQTTLLLREPSRFGERIFYQPAIESMSQVLFPFVPREPESVRTLIRRVDAARRQ